MKSFFKYLCAAFLISVSGTAYAQECISLDVDYTVEVSKDSRINGTAEVIFQDKSFKFFGNGIESYCDGEAIWLLDFEAKEAYIEAVTPDYEAYMDELAERLRGLETGLETSFLSPEGQKVSIKVNSTQKTDRKDISSFRPNINFDSSWIVTDLR